jgi:sec-independent protein translocase protein TatA
MLLAGIGPLGIPELLIIAFIVLLIFGVGRLPEVFGGLGKGIKEFRKNAADDAPDGDTQDNSATVAASSATAADISAPASDVSGAQASAEGVFCTECGARNTAGAKFCASCGKSLTAAVS